MNDQLLRNTGKTVICGKEYTIEELRKGIKNPFYEKLVKEVTIPIRHEDYAVFQEIAQINGETPESVVKRCVRIAAKELQEN